VSFPTSPTSGWERPGSALTLDDTPAAWRVRCVLSETWVAFLCDSLTVPTSGWERAQVSFPNSTCFRAGGTWVRVMTRGPPRFSQPLPPFTKLLPFPPPGGSVRKFFWDSYRSHLRVGACASVSGREGA